MGLYHCILRHVPELEASNNLSLGKTATFPLRQAYTHALTMKINHDDPRDGLGLGIGEVEWA